MSHSSRGYGPLKPSPITLPMRRFFSSTVLAFQIGIFLQLSVLNIPGYLLLSRVKVNFLIPQSATCSIVISQPGLNLTNVQFKEQSLSSSLFLLRLPVLSSFTGPKIIFVGVFFSKHSVFFLPFRNGHVSVPYVIIGRK